jgi:hypothetical protein
MNKGTIQSNVKSTFILLKLSLFRPMFNHFIKLQATGYSHLITFLIMLAVVGGIHLIGLLRDGTLYLASSSEPSLPSLASRLSVHPSHLPLISVSDYQLSTIKAIFAFIMHRR